MTNNFRTAAQALQPYLSDTYDLLNAADAVLSALAVPSEGTHTAKATYSHDVLVFAAIGSPDVSAAYGTVADPRKINAIKALRTLSSCGLREAKGAVEDQRFLSALPVPPLADWERDLLYNKDPWAISDHDADEPPF